MTRFSCPAWWTIRASASRFPSPFSGTKRTALMSSGGVNANETAKAAALVDGREAASGRAVSADGRAAVSPAAAPQGRTDRKSGVSGERVSVRVDLDGRRSIQQTKRHATHVHVPHKNLKQGASRIHII